MAEKVNGAYVDAKRWRGVMHFTLRESKWVCTKVHVPAAQFMVGWSSLEVRDFCQRNGWEFRDVGKVKG